MGTVPLREYLEQRIDDLEKNLTEKIEASRKASEIANEVAKDAVVKAENAVERRLEGLNELRELVSDYQQTLLPRTEADTRFQNFDEKLSRLEEENTARTGRSSGLAAGWGYLVAAVGMICLVAAVLISILG